MFVSASRPQMQLTNTELTKIYFRLTSKPHGTLCTTRLTSMTHEEPYPRKERFLKSSTPGRQAVTREWLTVKVGTLGHLDFTSSSRQAEPQVVGAPFKAHLLGPQLIGGDEALLAHLLGLIICTPPTAFPKKAGTLMHAFTGII